MKTKLYKEIERINDSGVKNFVKIALDNAVEQFWLCPSSSTGKYHPLEDQGEGGLIRHLIKATEISYELANFHAVTSLDRDIVVAATILHDIQKNGMPWKENTDYRHGLIAYNWLEQYNNKTVNAIEIRTCIRYHMGRWCSPKEEIERAIKPNTNELIVQLADYMSSRKNVSFLPGISLSEDSIRNYSAT